MSTTREMQLLETFATLADTLVDDYDVVDVLQVLVDACQDLLDVTAAGILLADERDQLELVVSTSEAISLVETMQLSAEAGPCIQSFITGLTVTLADISEAPEHWVDFRDSALEQGFHSVEAIPLRLRDSTIGTLNLLRTETGELGARDRVAARAFADVATIGILQERTLRESSIVREQLQNALTSRILVEQAKGVVAQTRLIPVDEAFTLMRSYARANRIGIVQVATLLLNRELTL